LSFFDDGEEIAPRAATRTRPSAGGPPRRPLPRRPQNAGGPPLDRHTLMVRRRVAVGVGVVLLILIVLLINGCLKSQKQQSLKDYNRHVSELAQESDAQVSRPLFTALSGAAGKSALDVEVQIDQLRIEAQSVASKAKNLSVPGEMTGAQRALLMAMNLRVEGVTKVAALLPTALGGQGKQATVKMAGDMEIFLASDVIFSQRVIPLIQQELSSNGIHGRSTSSSRSLPNLGWLDPAITLSRITGQAASTTPNGVTPGTHGSSLVGVAVGTNTLAPEPTLNHITGGSSPTFTVTAENTGSNPETNVKVDITVTAGGKQFKASHAINSTQPGTKVNVEIPVSGVPLGVASKIEANVEPVPGEANAENNKNTYLAIFGR
jgi:hypothetical protein